MIDLNLYSPFYFQVPEPLVEREKREESPKDTDIVCRISFCGLCALCIVQAVHGNLMLPIRHDRNIFEFRDPRYRPHKIQGDGIFELRKLEDGGYEVVRIQDHQHRKK